jgi:hypothetical protein
MDLETMLVAVMAAIIAAGDHAAGHDGNQSLRHVRQARGLLKAAKEIPNE